MADLTRRVTAIALTATAVTLTACATPPDQVAVTRIVDGDTIVVDKQGEETKVRLLNIDTPEQGECLYEQATAHLTELIPPGTKVTLEYDVERRDRYGRELAGVFTDVFVNEQMLIDGFARAVTFDPNTKFTQRAEAAEAMAGHTGIHAVGPECLLPTDVAKQALERYERDPDPFYKDVMTDAVERTPNFTYREQALEFIDSL